MLAVLISCGDIELLVVCFNLQFPGSSYSLMELCTRLWVVKHVQQLGAVLNCLRMLAISSHLLFSWVFDESIFQFIYFGIVGKIFCVLSWDVSERLFNFQQALELQSQNSNWLDDVGSSGGFFRRWVGEFHYAFNCVCSECFGASNYLNAGVFNLIIHSLANFRGGIFLKFWSGLHKNCERNGEELLGGIAHDVKSAHQTKNWLDLSFGDVPMFLEQVERQHSSDVLSS